MPLVGRVFSFHVHQQRHPVVVGAVGLFRFMDWIKLEILASMGSKQSRGMHLLRRIGPRLSRYGYFGGLPDGACTPGTDAGSNHPAARNGTYPRLAGDDRTDHGIDRLLFYTVGTFRRLQLAQFHQPGNALHFSGGV